MYLRQFLSKPDDTQIHPKCYKLDSNMSGISNFSIHITSFMYKIGWQKIGSKSIKNYIRIKESKTEHIWYAPLSSYSTMNNINNPFKYFWNSCKSYIIMTKKRIKANHITTCCYYVMLSSPSIGWLVVCDA